MLSMTQRKEEESRWPGTGTQDRTLDRTAVKEEKNDQSMKRMACEEVDKLVMEGRSVGKRSRTSAAVRTSDSEKEMSIRKYFKNKTWSSVSNSS